MKIHRRAPGIVPPNEDRRRKPIDNTLRFTAFLLLAPLFGDVAPAENPPHVSASTAPLGGDAQGTETSTLAGAGDDEPTCDDPALTDYYAPTSWPSVHRDSGNSNFVPFVAPTLNHVTWTALEGAATLVAPSIGPEGNV